VSRVLVVCARRYNGHELWTALGVMQRAGHTFEVISSDTDIEDEVTGQRNTIERTIHDVDPSEMESFDGLMIVSGNMADTEAYWSNKTVLGYVDAAEADQKQIAAVCCSVPTVRYAAKGKKVSFFPLVRSRQILKEAGAILQTVALTVDQNLATAEHQMATQMWANAFSKMLNGEDPEVNLVDSGYIPRGRPRKPIEGMNKVQARLAQTKDIYLIPNVTEENRVNYAYKLSRATPVKLHTHISGEECNGDCIVLGEES